MFVSNIYWQTLIIAIYQQSSLLLPLYLPDNILSIIGATGWTCVSMRWWCLRCFARLVVPPDSLITELQWWHLAPPSTDVAWSQTLLFFTFGITAFDKYNQLRYICLRSSRTGSSNPNNLRSHAHSKGTSRTLLRISTLPSLSAIAEHSEPVDSSLSRGIVYVVLRSARVCRVAPQTACNWSGGNTRAQYGDIGQSQSG